VVQLPTNPEAAVPLKANDGMLLLLTALAFVFVIILGLTGCGTGSSTENGFPNPTPLPLKLAVIPAPIAVAMGSTTTFTASPSPPPGFSLVWSVNPSSGGTITNSGIYTASESAGNCTVVATWIPANPLTGNKVNGSAAVTVLQPVALNTSMIQASGAIQTSGQTQNSAIAGEHISSVTSTDPTGNTQVRNGFPIPVQCPGSNTGCE
jgi:hypothetical protein